MTRAQVHVDRLADFTVQLLETIKPYDACEIHTDLVEAPKGAQMDRTKLCGIK
jgi:hypothetical protein